MKNLLLLTGGASAEREASINSRDYIMQYIDTDKFNVIDVMISSDKTWFMGDMSCHLLNKHGRAVILSEAGEINVDIVFPIVLGDAEDGSLNGFFRSLNLPFACSNVLASAVGFDKIFAKRILSSYGINIVPFLEYYDGLGYEDACKKLGVDKLFVKASRSGSSFGVSKAANAQEFKEAVRYAQQYDKRVLIEKYLCSQTQPPCRRSASYVSGVRELFCGVLVDNGNVVASEIGEVFYDGEIFDYEAKYISTSSEVVVPTRLDANVMHDLQEQARFIFKALNCGVFARVDFFLHEGVVYFSEINTVPAMTPKSLFLKLMAGSGYDKKYVINSILSQAGLED